MVLHTEFLLLRSGLYSCLRHAENHLKYKAEEKFIKEKQSVIRAGKSTEMIFRHRSNKDEQMSDIQKTKPRGYRPFSVLNSTEMKFFPLVNVKMQTTVGILTIMNWKNSIISLSEPEKLIFLIFFNTCLYLKFHAQLS